MFKEHGIIFSLFHRDSIPSTFYLLISSHSFTALPFTSSTCHKKRKVVQEHNKVLMSNDVEQGEKRIRKLGI